MKRRLDPALALAHRPRVLFLDEPTTRLDIQSRTDLWNEVRGLARGDGVTVFLTAQYLEEVDSLAGRVGIIDHGRIVAEGTPAALKAESGEPTVEAVCAAHPAGRGDVARVLARFAAGDCPHAVDESAAVRLKGGDASLADVVGALASERIPVARLQIHAPNFDDVFLAKTGRTLEASADDDESLDGDRQGQTAPERAATAAA